MKSPAEYAAEAIRNTPADYGTLPVIIAAVELALADADRYRTYLLGAVLRSKPSATTGDAPMRMHNHDAMSPYKAPTATPTNGPDR
jgi:hypothetical protein